MSNSITIKQLSSDEEVSLLDAEFSSRYPWYEGKIDYFARCLTENAEGKRITLLVYYEGGLAGCCHLLFASKYPYFQSQGIPEINDLNVFPEYRRKKIASVLFDELEKLASAHSRRIGLGVGLYRDYGNAQTMYTKRGYALDGHGIMYKNMPVEPGQSVRVDDDLLLYLIKELDQKG